MCAGCEVRAECLQFALDNDERFGVWGGLSERERRPLAGHGPVPVATPPATDGEKPCTKCGDEKPMTEFGADRNLPFGRKRWCRECIAAYRRENPEVAA